MTRPTLIALIAGLLAIAPPALANVTEDLAAGKIPMYPGAKPHPVKVAGDWQAIATLNDPPERIIAFYRQELPKRGWKASAINGVLSDRLDQVPLALLMFERGGTRLRVVVARKPKQPTSLWLTTERIR